MGAACCHGGNVPAAERECGPVETKVKANPLVKLISASGGSHLGHYSFGQTVAMVRHGDRLDHTPEWESSPERLTYPNDTPLTAEGHEHAREVGNALKATGTPFAMIVASPYLRCAQTASRIAQVLNVPVHFDLDMGEVFDDVSMHNVVPGETQHRPPLVLEATLAKDFPDVTWIRDENMAIKVEGKLQQYPEDFDSARMRFCYKSKKLLQEAASELLSIVIVTHGDALSSVVGMLREDWKIDEVPYTAYAICSRQVDVMNLGCDEIKRHEPVYVNPEEWNITLSKDFRMTEIRNSRKKALAHAKHEKELVQMNSQASAIDTEYTLDDEQVKRFHRALSHLGAHEDDRVHLMERAASSHHLANDRDKRIRCAPHSIS